MPRRLEQETIAYNSYLTTKLSTNRIWIVNDLVKSLKQTGIWSNLDRLWLFASESNQAARISLVNPSSTAITEVNAPAWVANQGYTGDGATSYLNTNYTPSTQSVKHTLNSSSFGVYLRSDSNVTALDSGSVGSGTGASVWIRARQSGVVGWAANDAGTGTAPTVAASSGFTSVSRTTSTAITIDKNGVSLGTSSNVSTSLSNTAVYILGANNNGTLLSPSLRESSACFIGSGTINSLTLYNTIQTYMTALGTQI